MFLRKTSRFKDGKRHDYWSVARAGARVVQRQLLYLGEIDEDRQNAWLNAIDELEERKAEDAASYLIPPQPEPKRETSTSVRIRLSKMTVENIREWGACWLGLCLWDLVGLDEFWTSRLLPSSHGTDWLAVFKAIVLYRTGPSRRSPRCTPASTGSSRTRTGCSSSCATAGPDSSRRTAE